MAIIFDASAYFTRIQSDARYVRLPSPPTPPTALTFVSSAVVTTPFSITATAIFTLTPPLGYTIAQYQFQFTDPDSNITTQLIPSSGPFVCTGLLINTAYTVAARSIDAFGQASSYTSTIPITTSDDVPALNTPTLSGLAVSDGALLFISPLNIEVYFSYYQLLRATNSSLTSPTDVVNFTVGDVLDRVIPATANYWYQVLVWDIYGNSYPTNIVGPFSLQESSLPTYPATPDISGGTATPNSDGSITVAWPANTDSTLTNYRIWRRLHSTSLWEQYDWIAGSPGINTTYTDVNCLSGNEYDYSVSAINNSNEESSYDSTGISATSDCTDDPATPTSFIFTNAQGTVGVSWTGSVSSGSSSSATVQYGLSYRLLSTNAFYPEILVNGTSFTIYGLTATKLSLEGELEVEVRALNNAGNYSTYLDHVLLVGDLVNYSPAPGNNPPNPLIVTQTDNVDGSETLSWATVPFSLDGETVLGYRIMRWDSVSSEWTWLVDYTGGITYTDLYLEPYTYISRTYQYSVQTLGTLGDISAWNYVFNAGFEFQSGSTEGWTLAADAGAVDTIVNTPVEDGSAALCANYAGRASQSFPVIANLVYTFSVYVRQGTLGTSGTNAEIQIAWYDSGHSLISAPNNTATATTNYQTVSVANATAPSNAVTATVSLLGDSSNPTYTFLWDDAYFELAISNDIYGDNKTDIIEVIDTIAPVQTSSQLAATASGQLGGIFLNFLTGTNPRFLGAVYEIFETSGPTLIATIPIFAESTPQFFDVTSISVLTRTTESFNFKVKDIYGNESAYILGTAISATSLNLDDVQSYGSTTPPAEPTGTACVANADGSITTTWTANTEANLEGYVVYRQVDSSSPNSSELPPSSFEWVVAGIVQMGPGGTPQFIDAGLALGLLYDYTISAFNIFGYASAYNTVTYGSATAGDTRTPDPPTSPIATGVTGAIVNTWTATDTTLITNYSVEISLDNGGTWGSPIIVTGLAYTQVYTDGKSAAFLLANYLFRVAALARQGSAQSTWATSSAPNLTTYVPIDTTGPDPATSFAYTQEPNGAILLTWVLSDSVDVDHYALYRQYGSDGYVFAANLANTVTSYNDVGLELYIANNESYSYNLYTVSVMGLLSTAANLTGIDVVADSTTASIGNLPALTIAAPTAGLSGTGTTVTVELETVSFSDPGNSCWNNDNIPGHDHRWSIQCLCWLFFLYLRLYES